MPREFHRSQRVAEELQRVLSEVIRSELDDPRLEMITITDVRVSRDLSHARVGFSVLDPERSAPAEVSEVLDGAAGFLRGVVGRRMVLRTVPQLHFEYDDSVIRGNHLSALIDNAVASDRRRAGPGDDDSDVERDVDRDDDD